MSSPTPIIPIIRREPFDDPAWLFDLKLDGFLSPTGRAPDVVEERQSVRRFERLLDGLPTGYVFDGEIVALDDDGRPVFNDLLFGRRPAVYVAFDVMVANSLGSCGGTCGVS